MDQIVAQEAVQEVQDTTVGENVIPGQEAVSAVAVDIPHLQEEGDIPQEEEEIEKIFSASIFSVEIVVTAVAANFPMLKAKACVIFPVEE